MSLSQKEFANLRGLYESVYAPKAETILEGFTDEDLDLTDEEIEEQVEEFFFECIEEGYDIDDVERIICEAIDSELQMLSERVDPKETQRRRDQAKDRLATGRAMKSAAAKSSASDSSDNKASTLSRVKGAVKKVKSGLKAAGEVAKGGVGLATRAVGTAQRAASAVKGAAKKGYERGRHGAGGSSSTSSASGGTSSTSSTSSASGGSSSASGDDSSSSDSSAAPKKRKDGLLKRGLKKVVRGITKSVSAGAGAVKAGADYLTTRARKESMNHKDFKTIQELYNSIYEPQQVDEENVEEGIDFKGAAREQARRDAIQAEKDKKSPSSKDRRLAMGKFRPGASAAERAEGGRDAMREKGTSPTKNGKKMFEELQATGLFTEKEIDAILEASEDLDEATAMAKRGYDEAPIRQKIAKSTGGGQAADRATKLASKPTFGNDKAAKQRSDYARKQRGDFRKTTSSSPGLHGYAHKSDDSNVKAKQAARGAQRGALTPDEKKSLGR